MDSAFSKHHKRQILTTLEALVAQEQDRWDYKNHCITRPKKKIVKGDFAPAEAGEAMMKKMGLSFTANTWQPDGVFSPYVPLLMAPQPTPTALMWNMKRPGTRTKTRYHIVVLEDYVNGNLRREAGQPLCQPGTTPRGQAFIESLQDEDVGELDMCPTCEKRAEDYGLTIPGTFKPKDIPTYGKAEHQFITVFEVLTYSYFQQEAIRTSPHGEFVAGRAGGGGYMLFDGRYRSARWLLSNCQCRHCGCDIHIPAKCGVRARSIRGNTPWVYVPQCLGRGHALPHGEDYMYKQKPVFAKVSTVYTSLAKAAGAENMPEF